MPWGLSLGTMIVTVTSCPPALNSYKTRQNIRSTDFQTLDSRLLRTDSDPQVEGNKVLPNRDLAQGV